MRLKLLLACAHRNFLRISWRRVLRCRVGCCLSSIRLGNQSLKLLSKGRCKLGWKLVACLSWLLSRLISRCYKFILGNFESFKWRDEASGLLRMLCHQLVHWGAFLVFIVFLWARCPFEIKEVLLLELVVTHFIKSKNKYLFHTPMFFLN